ncbi:hypothetical protein HanXRQr2_Chr07g0301991 [Helianthus annuus]|uniref:Uncharacterized protein n=1 Tax=Helianthus annuus TaxID=4232 RepID=A0A9K3IMK2_HELAN|nr:hypothetical protein HanXRQr2_Chr07g0301991 [Helianthus annuus]KAJ0905289.1 hypothetical protein HanPSC8_Chr07g0292281 [Helianthus annuus]
MPLSLSLHRIHLLSFSLSISLAYTKQMNQTTWIKVCRGASQERNLCFDLC